MIEPARSLRELSCADDYDPDSLSVDAARAAIRRFLQPVTTVERVHIRAALDRVLAEDITSPIDVPAMTTPRWTDGRPVRGRRPVAADDAPSRGESFAGEPYRGAVGRGCAVRIFTGAVMPDGADTVVMQERATPTADGVTVAPGAVTRTGQNRRLAGEDMKRGAVVFRAGQPVRPAELGMLASIGVGECTVYRKLRVAFFSTGDELRSIGQPLGAGEIYDSNRYTLYVSDLWPDSAVDMGVVKDTPADLERAFSTAAQSADVVITSGGVSVGEADYVKQLLDRLGEVLFWKIAMKPGRPLAYGKIGNAHFFGLPGNPVAVMVTLYQFVRDALLIMQGQREVPALPTFKVPLSAPIKKLPGRTEFQRAILTPDGNGGWTVA
jgi:molybdopterin molybdotransferase